MVSIFNQPLLPYSWNSYPELTLSQYNLTSFSFSVFMKTEYNWSTFKLLRVHESLNLIVFHLYNYMLLFKDHYSITPSLSGEKKIIFLQDLHLTVKLVFSSVTIPVIWPAEISMFVLKVNSISGKKNTFLVFAKDIQLGSRSFGKF